MCELTGVSRPGDGSRVRRDAIDRSHLASASSRAKTVKLADLCDSARDIFKHDTRAAHLYLVEMGALLEVLGEGHPRLMAKARPSMRAARSVSLRQATMSSSQYRLNGRSTSCVRAGGC